MHTHTQTEYVVRRNTGWCPALSSFSADRGCPSVSLICSTLTPSTSCPPCAPEGRGGRETEVKSERVKARKKKEDTALSFYFTIQRAVGVM